MLRALNSAVSGMKAAQTQINTIAHNLANMGTDGFKQQRVELASVGSGDVGGGVRVTNISEDSTPGPQVIRNGEVHELSNSAVAENVVNLRLAETQFRANLQVARISLDLMDNLVLLNRR